MPSRLVREGILTSERVEQLDFAAEVFYRRLMSKVDDHGLYDARMSILRTSLYPLRVDRVREADISRWIAACEKAGLIALYVVDGKPYLQMLDTRWTTRSDPKFPLPPSGLESSHLNATENSCAQPQTAVPVVVVGVGDENGVGDGKRKTKAPASPSPLPDWMPTEAWSGFLAMRTKIRKPPTDRARELLIAKLDAMRQGGHDIAAELDQSTVNGWQDLFPLKADHRAQRPAPKVENFASIDYGPGGRL